LTYALAQNLFSKNEINEMIENTIRRFEKGMHDFRLEMRGEINVLRLEMKEVESSIDKKMSLKLGSMTGIITLAITISHFLH